MFDLMLLLILLGVIELASIGCLVGLVRLLPRTKLGGRLGGEIVLTIGSILPECLIALHASIAPGRLARDHGDPHLLLGATMGAAAANMLVIGILNLIQPRQVSLEAVGGGRPLAAAAVTLLVAGLTMFTLGASRSLGDGPARIAVGFGIVVVLVACLQFIADPRPEKLALPGVDPMFASEQGATIKAAALTGVALLVLVYATPPFVALAIPWFGWALELPIHASGPVLGVLMMAIGLALALPDFVLATGELRSKRGDSPIPRPLLASAALLALTTLVGSGYPSLWYSYDGSFFGACWLIVFVVALVIVLFLAIPTQIAARPRVRGLIVVGIVAAGFAIELVSLRR